MNFDLIKKEVGDMKWKTCFDEIFSKKIKIYLLNTQRKYETAEAMKNLKIMMWLHIQKYLSPLDEIFWIK